MKSLIRKIVGERAFNFLVLRYRYLRNFFALLNNFLYDLKMFYRHSNVFRVNSFEKIEAKIILNYHGIEKGFVHDQIRPRFAIKRVKNLIAELNLIEKEYCHNSQTLIAQKVLIDYYEYHHQLNISISDYFPEKIYKGFKSKSNTKEKSFVVKNRVEYFSDINKSFDLFSDSRKSIRSFTSEKITQETIEEVVSLASNAPSVCNRQPSKAYFINNKKLVNQVLDIQGGLTGFQNEINQILVVTVDRNYFYTIGERNQFYIDGGIYLLNVMYALHFKKIGCCPANWGKTYDVDKKAQRILKLKESEKIICVLAIGYIQDEIKYTLSKRRPLEEMLRVLE
ncbi:MULTISPECIES: nitroreductase family protein [Flavobacteriaceae]|uniref:nitroreductase family protein n=1 Tax=Flavobacteriaceae TaxID=49546 RepID=UPI00234BDB73|nr:nitroreductase family protein [Muricauda sp. SP22]MDC6362084.1 nitroreductase family protein [Muricauda sp. SP22]